MNRLSGTGVVGLISLAVVATVATLTAQMASPTTVAAPTSSLAAVATTQFAVVDETHLHNAHQVTPKLISGAQPEGEEAFKALHDLGVKTIISVDGATPDVAAASKFGMHYVHLPIEYSGVTEEQGRAIAKAIDELPGPIYLHCHHGKHRSAAAAAVACVYNGSLKPEQAEAVLKTFGTGENYKGLWQAARDARPLDPAALAAVKVDYVEVAKLADFAEMMVKLDENWDNVKLMQKAGWETPKDHPDLDAAHEVLQVEEHLTEAGRLDATAKRPEQFRKFLLSATVATTSLEKTLEAKPLDKSAADKSFATASASCLACHKVYRD